MQQVSILLNVFFLITTLFTVGQFYRASNKSNHFLVLISGWMLLQFIIVLTGFYDKPGAVPPRLMLQLLPALIFIIVLFLTPKGKVFIDRLDIKQLTWIHTSRIAVEFILYYLFIAKVIPRIMTFEGRNLDILAGWTAPIMVYFGFVTHKISRKGILIWNLISLCLLINIIAIAVLAAPSPFQQFAFNETNTALGHFPFNWLPSVIVPIVLFSHLATIRQLIIEPADKEA